MGDPMTTDDSASAGLALDLRGMMEFVKGGIVSKTLVETSEMEVDLFLLAEGQALSEHTSSRDAVVHILEGEGVVALGRMNHLAQAGYLYFIPANLPHSVEARKDLAFILTMAH
jgi:nitric oxide dioxygenase